MIAFTMECLENGIIDKEDIGRDLPWGDAAGICWMVEQIANREGFGDILAEGMARAAEKIGKGSEKYAFHIKGNDLPLHDGRGKTGMALGYALSSTGADHVECPHDVAFQGEGYKALSALGVTEPVRPLDIDADKVRFFPPGAAGLGHQQSAFHLQLLLRAHPRHELPESSGVGARHHRLGHQPL